MRRLAIAPAVMLAVSVPACLWDYDTLSMEAKGMPDVVDVIVGRFERNPPLYYEMRLERVAKDLATHPDRLLLYDDAAVACDRLGRGDEGMEWLDRKHEALKRLDPDRARDDDWYKYFANTGTLRVHRWARNGMKQEDVAELEQAIKEIEVAIEINPDAHFGREWVQLGLMKVMLASGTGTEKQVSVVLDEMIEGRESADLVEGLVGLVALGNAWESPDVFALLSSGQFTLREQSIAYIALQRSKELSNEGRDSLLSDKFKEEFLFFSGDRASGQTTESLDKAYRELRENAEEFHRNRTELILVRLESGRHPDTDTDFWTGYVETPRADVRKFEPLIPMKTWHSPFFVFGTIAVVFIGLPLALFFVGRTVYRRVRAAKLPPGA
jgi:tetratricopeptide (TPR) repeat protein